MFSHIPFVASFIFLTRKASVPAFLQKGTVEIISPKIDWIKLIIVWTISENYRKLHCLETEM